MAFLTRSIAIEWIASLDPSATAENDVIDRLLTVVEAAVAQYLGFPASSAGGTPTIEDVTYTHYTGAGLAVVEDGASLMLSVYPVQSVTSVAEDSLWSYATAKDATDYVLDGAIGRIDLTPGGSWGKASTGRRNVKVVYVAGFTTVPAPIVQAGYMLVSRLFTLRRTQDKNSISEGGISIGLVLDAISPDVAKMMDPYRLLGAVTP